MSGWERNDGRMGEGEGGRRTRAGCVCGYSRAGVGGGGGGDSGDIRREQVDSGGGGRVCTRGLSGDCAGAVRPLRARSGAGLQRGGYEEGVRDLSEAGPGCVAQGYCGGVPLWEAVGQADGRDGVLLWRAEDGRWGEDTSG